VKKCQIIPTIAVSRRPHDSGPPGKPTRLEYRDLLEIFLQHGNVHLYQDIETVMSIVESWISTMELHSPQRRTLVNVGDVAS
jgi:hypothetical protein